ncbi:MAG: hypothetical protein E7579_05415 [Ruminococcaceae bacterium]|nr:hypothetical protein [Oscillospiraceae bacterium]
MTQNILRKEEKAIFDLRELYETHGYKKYKMSKFEEYDLYAENRSFLAEGNIITFNDTHGKLLALKPDVTLSIVKNAAAGERIKEYYTENVYRAIDGEYREIMQVGLECIGEADLYSTCEVIMLAKKSLACISKDYILDLSSAAFVGGLFENRAIPYDVREQLLTCVSGKNPHDLARICRENGIDDDTRAKLTTISETYGKVEDVIAALRPLAENDTMTSALDELEAIYNFMTAVGEGDNLRLDFSLINDMSYYDGIIFRGYIDGVARGVLSGGRYDKLLDKMGKHTGAIGFAIYMNTLDLYFEDKNEYDVDILITYDDTADLAALTRTVKMLTGGGRSVRVQKTSDGTLKCREHFRYGEGGLDIETT